MVSSKDSLQSRPRFYSLEGLSRPPPRQHTFPFEPDTHVDIYLKELAEKYKINVDLVERLHLLEDYEIVILCDDSGSMNTRMGPDERTRWDELIDTVKLVLEIATLFDENGVDVCFIHRPTAFNIVDPREIDRHFHRPPGGYGSLAPVLEYIFERPASKLGHDKNLLVFVATDGSLTDETDVSATRPLEKVMREKRQSETTHVMFLLCNDDPLCREYFSKWDCDMKNVDVTTHYLAERDIIRRFRGADSPFSFGDYVVKALIGAIDPEIDAFNEPIAAGASNHRSS